MFRRICATLVLTGLVLVPAGCARLNRTSAGPGPAAQTDAPASESGAGQRTVTIHVENMIERQGIT
jgi:hypothetical protein